MRHWRSLRLAAVVLVLGAAPASAGTPTALIQEGLPLPGGPADFLVSSINNPAVNHSGGYAFNVITTDGVATLSRFWSDGAVLRTEGTFGVYEQTAWESFYGLGGSNTLAYSPTCNNSESGSTGLDGVWLDDVPIAVEENVYPWASGFWWSFGSRPGVTEDGIPYFVGGITDVQGGSTDNRGLFYGLDAQPLLLGGQIVPGLPAALGTGTTVSFDYRVSAFGNHYLAEVETVEPAATNNYLVMDGAGLEIAGALVGEGRAVPLAAGGLPGENWANFDFEGVTDDGHYLFTGDTAAATAVDEFVVLDGMIVLREGDMVDGWQLTGSISGAYLNDDGDYAVAWEVVGPAGSLDALIFNGAVVLVEGDPVDLDGDGGPDGGTAMLDFTGISALVLGDRDDHGVCRMYFTANVDVAPVGRAVVASPAAGVGSPEDLGYEDEIPAEGDRVAVEMGLVLAAAVISTAAPDVAPAPQASLVLGGPQPNPFNPQTRLSFTVERPQHVRLAVFDTAGRLVRTLADEAFAAGSFTRTWDGRDDAGLPAPSGTYLARIVGEDDAQTVKLTMTK